jgi:hypothetical protein
MFSDMQVTVGVGAFTFPTNAMCNELAFLSGLSARSHPADKLRGPDAYHTQSDSHNNALDMEVFQSGCCKLTCRLSPAGVLQYALIAAPLDVSWSNGGSAVRCLLGIRVAIANVPALLRWNRRADIRFDML